MPRILSAAVLLTLLAGCDTELRPTTMHADARRYVGRWVHDWVDPKDATRYVRVYFEVAPDARAIYKRCISNAPQAGSNRRLTDFVVIDREAVLSMAIGYRILRMEYRQHFWIDDYTFHDISPPTAWPGPRRSLTLDGVRLTELAPGEKVDHQAWDCGR